MNVNEHQYKKKLANIHRFQDMCCQVLFYLLQNYPDDYLSLQGVLQDIIKKTDMQIDYLTKSCEEYDYITKEEYI